MTRPLNSTSVSTLRAGVAVPTYDRSQVQGRIVHIGVGNFHRAHQAAYCDDLLNSGEREWGIHGISLRSTATRDALAPQDYLYTLALRGQDSNYRVLGSLLSLSVAPEDPNHCIELLATLNTALITITITEKGYLLKDGHINKERAEYLDDIESLQSPKTVYGYLAAALQRRAERGAGPVTVLGCDNVHDGGGLLEDGVATLLQAHGCLPDTWIESHVSFASSVVDRVAPTTTNQLIADVEQAIGATDDWPVATETFTLWVIEDNFAGPRPPFDRFGAIFVDDVGAFERMKLAYLNAAHSMISAMGYLLGDEYVHEALERPNVEAIVRNTLLVEVTAATAIPDGMDAAIYVDSVLRRFKNKALPYTVHQVCSDSSQKIRQRWFPSIDGCIRASDVAPGFSFVLAAWVAYVARAVSAGELNDPNEHSLASIFESLQAQGEIIAAVLDVAGSASHAFAINPVFMSAVEKNFETICESGIEAAIHQQQERGQTRSAARA